MFFSQVYQQRQQQSKDGSYKSRAICSIKYVASVMFHTLFGRGPHRKSKIVAGLIINRHGPHRKLKIIAGRTLIGCGPHKKFKILAGLIKNNCGPLGPHTNWARATQKIKNSCGPHYK
jgi:hypothetical protein